VGAVNPSRSYSRGIRVPSPIVIKHRATPEGIDSHSNSNRRQHRRWQNRARTATKWRALSTCGEAHSFRWSHAAPRPRARTRGALAGWGEPDRGGGTGEGGVFCQPGAPCLICRFGPLDKQIRPPILRLALIDSPPRKRGWPQMIATAPRKITM
jgi:hypothetical protein